MDMQRDFKENDTNKIPLLASADLYNQAQYLIFTGIDKFNQNNFNDFSGDFHKISVLAVILAVSVR